jgi:hypothetical protein
MYQMIGGGSWQIETAGSPSFCSEVKFFPAGVLEAWPMQTTPPAAILAGGICTGCSGCELGLPVHESPVPTARKRLGIHPLAVGIPGNAGSRGRIPVGAGWLPGRTRIGVLVMDRYQRAALGACGAAHRASRLRMRLRRLCFGAAVVTCAAALAACSHLAPAASGLHAHGPSASPMPSTSPTTATPPEIVAVTTAGGLVTLNPTTGVGSRASAHNDVWRDR